jgi:hypothetical protein
LDLSLGAFVNRDCRWLGYNPLEKDNAPHACNCIKLLWRMRCSGKWQFRIVWVGKIVPV